MTQSQNLNALAEDLQAMLVLGSAFPVEQTLLLESRGVVYAKSAEPVGNINLDLAT